MWTIRFTRKYIIVKILRLQNVCQKKGACITLCYLTDEYSKYITI